jgi:Domain of unknown function (DUF4912)
MAKKEAPLDDRQPQSSRDFKISNGPVISHQSEQRVGFVTDYGELPRNYGAPILFAIPRDPHTIFTYWNIDWSNAFARQLPVDRQVYIRVKRSDGSDEAEQPVEPMLGTHYAPAVHSRGVYQVELGFYQPVGVWNSVATSDTVTMPPDSPSEMSDIDVATVPFHLSFQRLIDMFRAANGGAIASVLSRLQDRALGQHVLTAEEQEILRALNLSRSEIESARLSFDDQESAERLRKRAEALLGFGSSSASGGGWPG